MIVGRDRRLDRPLHTCAGAFLLSFTPSLHSGFRFRLDRHKFATGVMRRERSWTPATDQRRPAGGETRRQPAACRSVEQGM